ncbi:MAG: 16S rRNA (guanine(527)-N(7))-methyltransferase RsmG [Solirubrobacterales bacterium]|nr:16S rRNA (guanine(527)-N(7))-methyltransferase RsmG [Solirubrobacterales bacterium]
MTVEPPAAAQPALEAVIRSLAGDSSAPTSITDPQRARKVHLADSLSGLELEQVRDARRIADVGSGAGFPGLVLAACLPSAEVDLVESVGRKCAYLRRTIATAGIGNATTVCERAETLGVGAGREAYDVVTARAVGSLATLAELASPLLREGGALVAWKGRRDRQEEAELEMAPQCLAMDPVEVLEMTPYDGSRHRHIHVLRKNGPTPDELPRRPGMAAKRPLAAGQG